ncbi:ankyrin repeat-containing protein BDA1-like [Neltuma alba]|uniref:ankyrin repeat-containing protein BDA1-like n=1 Tax=Neltuma alba TaxID=207710 RepID=UPI0010A43885|nr:ankyrin repeat-containing protein BDA1-like [Prosopis alba]
MNEISTISELEQEELLLKSEGFNIKDKDGQGRKIISPALLAHTSPSDLNILSNEQISQRSLSVVWRADEQTLVQLLQADASILANIPSGCQTPLHISALLGNVPFTEALLHRNLAITGDSSGRTALHLACQRVTLRIVQILLHFNNELCLVRDGEKRIPLHYAAIRGRTEVVQELIMASPDSLSLVDGEDSTVFHLCVTHNHLDTLQTLVKLDYATANITAGQPRPPIFTGRPDRARNTILHLAIMLKRVEVVSYLRSIPEIMGFTADDILMKRSPKDLEICEIQHMLTPEEFEITGVVRVHDDE